MTQAAAQKTSESMHSMLIKPEHGDKHDYIPSMQLMHSTGAKDV